MANETLNKQALTISYSKKIQQATDEIKALDRYLKPDSVTGKNRLEEYLDILQKHPAANNENHPSHETIQQKIQLTQFNLNLIPKPDSYPTQQKSYMERYLLAKSSLDYYTKKLAELNKQKSDSTPVEQVHSPQIIPCSPSVVLGETAIFSVDTAGLDIIHYYWMAGKQKLSGKETFSVDTQELGLGYHEVRVSLTPKRNRQKPLLISTQIEVIEAPTHFENADIQLKQNLDSVKLSCQFIEQEKTFYNWLLDSFTSNFRKVSNGNNLPEFTVNNLAAGQYRIRLGITYKGTTSRLEKRFVIDKEIRTADSQTLPLDDFVAKTAKTFAANNNQDQAHNAIIRYLLSTTFANAYQKAYDVIRDVDGQPRVNDPLYRVRSRADLQKVSDSDFFIRDFMQVQTLGGSQTSPYIIGDKYSQGLQRNGLSIIDGAAESEFSDSFDQIVDKINNTDFVKQSYHKLFHFKRLAHRDAIQLIPYAGGNSQFSGAAMRNIIINGNVIESSASLQGIFASDGVFQNLQITNNSIDVAGAHTISISGMLSGKIDGNTDLQGRLLPAEKIRLYPLRIGGGANIYVMSFYNEIGVQKGDADYYAYETIKGHQPIDDRRTRKERRNASYWKHVNLPALQALFNQTMDKVRQLNKQQQQEMRLMQVNNRTHAAIQRMQQDYKSQIQDTWNAMMLQVAEPDPINL